jgi:bifunctional enzyme CysN/CysC
VAAIRHKIDINSLEKLEASELRMNEIGGVIVETHKPLFFDSYQRNRATGAFILIDPITNETMAAGMIVGPEVREAPRRVLEGLQFELSRVTPAERYSRAGHRPATIWLVGPPELAYAAERKLFDRGCLVNVLADEQNPDLLAELARISNAAGLITICSVPTADAASLAKAQEVVGSDRFVPLESLSADEICRVLEERGFIPELTDPLTGGAGI